MKSRRDSFSSSSSSSSSDGDRHRDSRKRKAPSAVEKEDKEKRKRLKSKKAKDDGRKSSSRKRKKEKKKRKKKKSKSKSRSKSKSKSGRDEQESDAEKRAAKLADMFGYTNEENPFGDANLTQQFVWEKKEKRDKEKKRSWVVSGGIQEASRLEEIQKARERRVEREDELMIREQQKEDEARMREAQTFEDWEEKEEEFHLKQQRERSKIRIKEGREKAIDAIAKNLLLYEEYMAVKRKEKLQEVGDDSVVLGLDIPVEVDEAYKIFHSMDVVQLEDVRKDIQEYRQSELSNPNATNHQSFWDALLLILADSLQRRKVAEGKGRVYASSGVHEKVDKDLQEMLLGKNAEELNALKAKVQSTVRSKDPEVDIEYWEAVLKGVDVAICKKLIDAQHSKILNVRLELLRSRQSAQKVGGKAKDVQKPKFDFDKKLQELKSSVKQNVVVLTEAEDMEQRRSFNEAVLRKTAMKYADEVDKQAQLKQAPSLHDAEIDRMIEEQEARPSGAESVMPNRDVVKLAPKTYSWQGRYKPRKPRFYNRVKTGYEWNKYNQAHYDEDNPPPKTVQGYKFNIFYPDLIDKQRAPTFRIEKADSPEFCILRFQAGAPYEDIAFKILNKEWSKQSFHGFKCVFERGILKLYFQFKRLYYRR